jgi:photosystem II stability/assembly factor-like uncharacterized protein
MNTIMKNTLLFAVIVLLTCILQNKTHAQIWNNIYEFSSASPSSYQLNPSGFQFTDTLNGYITITELNGGSSSDDAYLYKTSDGGCNWQQIYAYNGGIGDFMQLHFDFLNARDFFIFKDQSSLNFGYCYRDSVQTPVGFTPYGPPYLKNISLDTVIISNYVSSNSIALYLPEQDVLQPLPISDNYIYNQFEDCEDCDTIIVVDFINGFGAAVGKKNGLNYFFRSDEHFQNWEKLLLEIDGELNKLLFIDNYTGVLVKNNAELYRTIDGGSSWEFIELPSSITINGISFSNEKGYIIGNLGKLLISDDAGLTWNIENMNTTEDLIQISVDEKGFAHILSTDGVDLHLFTNNPDINSGNDALEPSQFVTVSPNPFKEKIKVSSPECMISISILNVNGEIIKSLRLYNTYEEEIDVSDLFPGLYIFQIEYLSGISRQKMIKI